MKQLILKSYPRIQFAIKEKIPLSLAVAKLDTDKNLGEAYIRNDEYWNWTKKVQFHNVYKLKESLDVVKETYDVETEDLVLAVYGKKGLTPELEAFIEKTWERAADESELKKRLKSWNEVNTEVQKQLSNIFGRIRENLKWLQKESKDLKIKTSPIQITEFELEGSVLIKVEGEKLYPIKAKNGLDVFLNSFTSFKVPFISYQSPDRTYLKVYDKELPYPLDKIKPPDGDITKPNTLNLVVLNKLKGRIGHDSYFHMKIDVNQGTFTFKTKSKEKIPLEFVEEHMPLKLTQVKEKNILGEYLIYGLNLNMHLFLDVIMTEPSLREMMYMTETSSFLAIKKKKMLHLREPNLNIGTGEVWNRNFSFLINQDEVSKTEVKAATNYFNEDRIEESVLVPARTPFLRVSITKSDTREAMQMGLLLFLSVISVMKAKEERLREIYKSHGVAFRKEAIKSLEKGERVHIPEGEPVRHLQNAAPHIFVTNYSKDVCQLPDQPSIIPDKLVKQWNQKQVDVYKKAVPFPYPNEEIYLSCERDPSKPYVSMKVNMLDNKEEYPYLPCCTTRNTQAPGSHTFFTHYYLQELLPEEREGSNVAVIKSRKPLLKNQTGVLHPTLQAIFGHFKVTKPEEVYRYGVSPSSFGALLCLLFATKNKEIVKYMESERVDYKRLEMQAKKMLRSDKIQAGLLSQELYGMGPEDIRVYLSEIDFFDTEELYRWLEEYFELHVFVFSAGVDGEIQLEIPRHRFFSVRRNLNRPCVLLYRHWGNRPEDVDFPYYELIMKGKNFIWPVEISHKMMDLFNQTQEIFQAHNRGGKTILRKNPYALLSYEDIFPGIKGQYLDEAGKLRGLLVDVGDKDHNQMTVYVPPGQPLNVPVEEYENSVSIELVLAYFDETPLYYSSEGEMVTGLWFRILDIEEGIYVPVIEMDMETFEGYSVPGVKKGRPNPVFAFESSLITEFHQMTKARNVYLFTLLWAFFIYDRSVPSFMKRYVKIGTFDVEDLEDLNTTLSSTQDIKYAMEYLDATFPFVSGQKFLCENREMMEKLEYFLTTSYEKSKLGDVPRADFIKDLYTLPREIPNFPDTQNFTSLIHFKLWLYARGEGRVDIIDKLTISLSLIKNPFLYKQKETGQLFLIQNVSLGERERALKNQLEIQETGNNLGYFSERYEGNVAYKNYIISPSGDLYPESDVDFNIRLLQYDEDLYASLIQI